MTPHEEIAVFGGGCFWCTEAIFKRLKGVISVTPGYAGGTLKNPSYHEVCAGTTGHAEVIEIRFNPEQITFDDLLQVFMHTHDPTSLNRQGNDVGTQYRSAIFYTSSEQQKQAEEYTRQLSSAGEFSLPIVTEVKKLDTFYPAESYHKDYFDRNSYQPYCQIVIAPKVKKLLSTYQDNIKQK